MYEKELSGLGREETEKVAEDKEWKEQAESSCKSRGIDIPAPEALIHTIIEEEKKPCRGIDELNWVWMTIAMVFYDFEVGYRGRGR